MLQRLDPSSELRQIQNTMDRIYRSLGAPSGEGDGAEMENWAVPLDVSRVGEDFVVRASMPGVSPDDIQVMLENNVLSIRGQTATQHQESSDSCLMRERRTGSFYKSLRLSDSVDADKVQSGPVTYLNGC